MDRQTGPQAAPAARPAKPPKTPKTFAGELFSSMAVMLLLGLALMCGIQTALSTVYFARERRAALTSVLDGAAMLSQRLAGEGTVVTLPDTDAALLQNARDRLALFETVSGAVVFVADGDGNILLSTGPDDNFTGRPVSADRLRAMDGGQDRMEQSDLGGVLTRRCYVAGRALPLGGAAGYLFVATPMDMLRRYLSDMLGIFVFSALLMLLFSGIVSLVMTRRLAAPVRAVNAAARRLGSGDFSARAPAAGYQELEDLSAAFNDMAARLQTIDNARGQFMGNIAHELRTPMTSIQGFIEGMRDGTIPPEEHEKYLAVVAQETARLSRLVQNMLDITRLEAGEVPIHAREYDIFTTVTDVVLADEQRIEEGHIDIEGLGGPPARVWADPDLVHQIVYNLVDNAIKFTPPGGVIRFAAAPQGEQLALSIENTGTGIAADALPYVFERFYKEDRSRGLNTRGAGLGLHISKVLVGLMGGTIRVESEEGQWCRFTFTLPARAPAAPPAPAGPNAGKKKKRRRK